MGGTEDASPLAKRGMRGAYDAAGARYDRFIVPSFAPIAQRVVQLAAPTSNERHVDLATGSGGLLRRIDTHRRSIGIDLSAEMLVLASRAARAARLIQGDLEGLPLKSATVDVATLACALHHLPDPHAALREVRRVLRRGGRLAVAAWDDVHGALWQAFDEWFERVGVGRPNPTPHCQRPIDTLEQLRQGLLEAGFEQQWSVSEPTRFRFTDRAAYWEWRVSFPGTHRALMEQPADERERLRREFISSAVGASARVRDDRNVLYAVAHRTGA